MKHQLLSCLLLITFIPAQACESLKDLQTIGQAELTVWGFSVYSARTLSCDGKQISETAPLPRPFALELTYARNIDQQELLNNTRKQWQRLGLYKEDAEIWLDQLRAIWPSVRDGDQLTLHVTTTGMSEFYFSGAKIGELQDAEFASNFLAIWLGKDASYQHARKKLMGETR